MCLQSCPVGLVGNIFVKVLVEYLGVLGEEGDQELFSGLELFLADEAVQLGDHWSFQLDSGAVLKGNEGVLVIVLTEEFEDQSGGLGLFTLIVFLQGCLDQLSSISVLPTTEFHVPNTEIEI